MFHRTTSPRKTKTKNGNGAKGRAHQGSNNQGPAVPAHGVGAPSGRVLGEGRGRCHHGSDYADGALGGQTNYCPVCGRGGGGPVGGPSGGGDYVIMTGDATRESRDDVGYEEEKSKSGNRTNRNFSRFFITRPSFGLKSGYKRYEGRLEEMRIQFEQRWKAIKNRTHQIEEADVYDFAFIHRLGSGAFGNVYLVRHKDTKNVYALKVLEKMSIMEVKMVFHALEEKRILNAVDYPFIIKTSYFFHDAKNIYFAMSFVPGGELYPYYKALEHLSEEQTKFYASQIVLALEYLQAVNVLYRDLKPENILIGVDGYLILVDMGFAKKKLPGELCYTMCGTPEYLAPEIILGDGYDEGVDWWSFGILIYELVYGITPFVGSPPIRMYQRIVKNKYTIPRTFSPPLSDLVTRLLNPDSSKRIGNKPGQGRAREVKLHRWFAGMDFFDIYLKKIHPPFVPHVKGPADPSFYSSKPVNFQPPKENWDPFYEYFVDF